MADTGVQNDLNLALPQSGNRDLAVMLLQGISDKIAGRQSGAGVSDLMPDIPLAPHEMVSQPVVQPGAPPPSPSRVATAPQSTKTSAYAWGGFENGRLPAAALKSVGQGGHRLAAPAADGFVAMRAAAASDGVSIKLTDSYRSVDQQQAVREKKGHIVATATPGTSVHGWGKAIDVNVEDAKTLAWLRANGARFGWVNPAWAQAGGKSHEPWHWEWKGMSK